MVIPIRPHQSAVRACGQNKALLLATIRALRAAIARYGVKP